MFSTRQRPIYFDKSLREYALQSTLNWVRKQTLEKKKIEMQPCKNDNPSSFPFTFLIFLSLSIFTHCLYKRIKE